MQFTDDVAAGTVLVRPALQSPDYVTGVSGWAVKVDGSAEFNDITIRGGTTVSGTALYYDGTPALGSLFLAIAAAAGTDTYGNPYNAGLTIGNNAQRQVHLTYDTEGGFLELPMNDTHELTVASIAARRLLAGSSSQQIMLQLASATQNVPAGTCAVRLLSGSVDAATPARFEVYTDPAGVIDLVLTANHLQTQVLPSTPSGNSVLNVQGPSGHAGFLLRVSDNGTNRLTVGVDGTTAVAGSFTAGGYVRGSNLQSDTALVSFVALSSFTQSVTFSTAYPAGVVPVVTTNINSVSGTTSRWDARATNITNTGFTLWVYKTDTADPAQTWTNVPVQWWAHAD